MQYILTKADFSGQNIGKRIIVAKEVNLIKDDGSSTSMAFRPNQSETIGHPIVSNAVEKTPLGQQLVHTLTFNRSVQTVADSSAVMPFLVFPVDSVLQSDYIGKIGFGCWIQYEKAASTTILATRMLQAAEGSPTALAGVTPSVDDFNLTNEATSGTSSSYLTGTVKTKVLASKEVDGKTWYYIGMLTDITAITGPYAGKAIICCAGFQAYNQYFSKSGTLDTLVMKVSDITFGYFDDYPDPNTLYPVLA